MPRHAAFPLFLFAQFLLAGSFVLAQDATRTITLAEYRDRMTAGWIGQIAGVARGAPTEFGTCCAIIPPEKMPEWTPDMANQAFNQDDLYVEMTFLRTLEEYGLDVSAKRAGIDFAKSRYMLWHANAAGRNNLRNGIAPPDSGHPKFNPCSDDIDYQIEADFAGLISPGMPNAVVELGEKFGRIMNYGDGVYAGVFVGAMYAEAFFETDIREIVERALHAIPAESQYAEMVRDMLRWSAEEPVWEKTWEKIERKYHDNPDYRRHSCSGMDKFNIDAKINGAYILMGLLYGEGDPDKTMTVATRCGQDSDCNPSNAAGVLFTSLGMKRVPARFYEKLRRDVLFSHTEYDFDALVAVCERLAIATLKRQGGVLCETDGAIRMEIPKRKAVPGPFLESCKHGEPGGVRFDDAEMEEIRFAYSDTARLQPGVARAFPDWTFASCGPDMEPGFKDYRNKKNVLMTHPLDKETGCMFSRDLAVPTDTKTTLALSVANHDGYDWELVVEIDGKKAYARVIDDAFTQKRWAEVAVDLTPYAGKEITIGLINKPNGWSYEAGYWSSIEIKTEKP